MYRPVGLLIKTKNHILEVFTGNSGNPEIYRNDAFHCSGGHLIAISPKCDIQVQKLCLAGRWNWPIFKWNLVRKAEPEDPSIFLSPDQCVIK
jgi:hypothetical protein